MSVPPTPVGSQVPTLQDAHLIADLFVGAGVKVVLLHGSVAAGTATADSDIDLIAVFDELDYADRAKIRGGLAKLAERITDADLDVYVTDRPEWRQRSERMHTTFEHHVMAQAMLVCDEPVTTAVQWSKQIGRPATLHAEVSAHLDHANRALIRIIADAAPHVMECTGDAESRSSWREVRLRCLNRASFMVATTCAKALRHWYGLPHLGTHNVGTLIASLPQPRCDEVESLFPGDTAATINLWGDRSGFPEDGSAHADLADNPAHAEALMDAACDVASYTASTVLSHPTTRHAATKACDLIGRVGAERSSGQPRIGTSIPSAALRGLDMA